MKRQEHWRHQKHAHDFSLGRDLPWQPSEFQTCLLYSAWEHPELQVFLNAWSWPLVGKWLQYYQVIMLLAQVLVVFDHTMIGRWQGCPTTQENPDSSGSITTALFPLNVPPWFPPTFYSACFRIPKQCADTWKARNRSKLTHSTQKWRRCKPWWLLSISKHWIGRQHEGFLYPSEFQLATCNAN